MSRSFERKKVSAFHVVEVNRHLGELFNYGETTCNSPFLRYLIYQELDRKHIRVTKKGADWGRNIRYGNQYVLVSPTVTLAYKYLKQGKYRPSQFMDNMWHRINKETTGLDEKTRMRLFDRKVTDDEKFGILTMIYNTQENRGEKYPLLGYACKTIKKLSISTPWTSRRLLYIGIEDPNSILNILPMEIALLIDKYSVS
jgi:hypothetical protein